MERRYFIKKSAIASSIALAPNLIFSMSNIEDEIPLIDYHVHLNRNLSLNLSPSFILF